MNRKYLTIITTLYFLLLCSPLTHAQGSWISIGPGGGPIAAIGKTQFGGLLAGTGYSGSIYANDGQGWYWHSEGLPSVSIVPSDFALDADGNVYFGASSHGVYKRTPKGAAWTPLNQGLPPFLALTALTRDLDDNLYAVVRASALGGTRVLKLPRGSDQWILFHEGLPNWGFATVNNRFIMDSSGNIYVSGFGVHRLLRGATTWTELIEGLTPPELGALAADNQGNVFGGNSQGVWQLAGERWVQYGLAGVRVRALAADDANNLYAASGDRNNDVRVLKLPSGGSWEDLKIPSRAIINVLATNDNTLYVGNTIGLFRFQEGLWSEYDQGLTGTENYRLTVDAEGSLYTIKLGFRAPFGEEIWLLRFSPQSGEWEREAPQNCCGLAADSLGNVLSVGLDELARELTAYRRDPVSGKWEDISAGLPDQLYNRMYQLSVARNNVAYAIVDTAPALLAVKLEAGSNTWQILPAIPYPYFMVDRASIAADSKGNVYAHVGAAIPAPFLQLCGETFVLETGMTAWRRIDLNSPYCLRPLEGHILYWRQAQFDHLAIDAQDNVFLAAGFRAGNSDVYKLDANEQWRPFNRGLPAVSKYSLKSDPKGTLFLATQEGVYVLPQGGEIWTALPTSGLITRAVKTTAVGPNGELFAATVNHSVFAFQP